ncbi:MAG: hypothetical protein WA971_09005 [Microbacterium sp.]
MSPFARRLALATTAVALTLSLSGCLYALIPEPGQGSGPAPESVAPKDEATTATDEPVTPTGTVDWTSLPTCDDEGAMPWRLLDGFPAGIVDAVGLQPGCGDIWMPPGDAAIASTGFDPVTTEAIDRLGAGLTNAGYELLFDDFDPESASGEEYYGARDFYLNGEYEGDYTRTSLEIYPSDSASGQWTVFLDFDSPATRAVTR